MHWKKIQWDYTKRAVEFFICDSTISFNERCLYIVPVPSQFPQRENHPDPAGTQCEQRYRILIEICIKLGRRHMYVPPPPSPPRPPTLSWGFRG